MQNSAYATPAQQRHLRACMVCSIVQLMSKYMTQGCPNCEEILSLRGSDERIRECTSQVYEGLVTLNDPQGSWVAKWQRLEGYVPGVYAVKVTGVLPEEVVADIEEAGVRYVPRDGSAQEEETSSLVLQGNARKGFIDDEDDGMRKGVRDCPLEVWKKRIGSPRQ